MAHKPMCEAGRYTAWILAGRRLYSVALTVPRTIYINSSAPPGDKAVHALGASCKRTLPHGDQGQHLFKACGCQMGLHLGYAYPDW